MSVTQKSTEWYLNQEVDEKTDGAIVLTFVFFPSSSLHNKSEENKWIAGFLYLVRELTDI